MDNHIHLLWQAEEGYTSRKNSVKEGLCLFPKEYEFLSASFYIYNDPKYEFLFHI